MSPPSRLIIPAGIAVFTATLMLLMAMHVVTASAADSALSRDSATVKSVSVVHDVDGGINDEIDPQRRRRSGLGSLIIANWEISLIIGGLLCFAILITSLAYNHHRAGEQSDDHSDDHSDD